MNFRTTTILFGVLLGMLFIFGIMVEVQKNVLDEGFLFPATHDATLNVESIELVKGGETFKFVKEKDKWTLTRKNKERWRIQESKMTSIINQVQTARKNEEADAVSDLAQVDLDDPTMRVTLVAVEKKDDQETTKKHTLFIGKKSSDAANVFVRSSERPRRAAAVKTSNLDAVFFKDVNELRDTSLLEITNSNGRAVSIVKKDKDNKVVKKLTVQKEGDNWLIKEPNYGIAAASRSGDDKDLPSIEKLLQALGNLRVDDAKDFVDRGAKDVAAFGAGKGKETLWIEIERTKGFSDKEKVKEILWVGDPAKKQDGDDIKDQRFVRLGSDNYVVRVDADKLKAVFEAVDAPEKLRSHDLAFFNERDPDAVNIRSGAGLKHLVELRKPDPTVWKMIADKQTYDADQVAIDGGSGWLSVLQGKGKITKFFDAKGEAEEKKLDKKLGLDAPALEVAVYVDAVEEEKKNDKKGKDKKKDGPKDGKKEIKLKKDAKPVVKLIFGKTEKDSVYIKRIKRIADQDFVSRVAVAKEILAKVTPAQEPFYLTFLKKELPPFDTAEAVKIELVRGGEKFVLEKKTEPVKKNGKDKGDKTNGKKKDENVETKEVWTISPSDIPRKPDENVIQFVLSKLGRISVSQWAKKFSPKEDLSSFGLKEPALTVTVTLKGEKDEKTKKEKKGDSRVFYFGTKVKSGKKLEFREKIYARVSGTDIVFQTFGDTRDYIKDVELRDASIFDFDTKKVRELSVKWQLPQKKGKAKTETLELKRKSDGDAWKVVKAEGADKDKFKLNEETASLFIQDIAKLRTERYISAKGDSAAHKLTPKDAALAVTIKLDDGKTKTFTMGAENKEKTGYYALASALPKVVFLVSKRTFQSLLEGVKHFKKE